MKTIRNLMTLAGLILAVFALSATGARAQAVTETNFAGTFTLSQPAEWGSMVLPSGNYSLRYGTMNDTYFVEVHGTTKGSPHGVIHVAANEQTSAMKSALVCTRAGNGLVVRKLEIPELGESVIFAMPRGAKLMAQNRKRNSHTQLAEASTLTEQIAVAPNAK